MAWMQKLYETYERCDGMPQFVEEPLLPVGHTQQQAHIEIVLNASGEFQAARVVSKENTVVAASEDSSARTTNIAPHALCDKLQYCAGDYTQFGGTKKAGFDEYLGQLRSWQEAFPAARAQAVLRYVEQGSVIADLVAAGVLFTGADGKLLTEWTSDASPMPEIMKVLTPKGKQRDQGDAFLRWIVEIPGRDYSKAWEDPEVREAWIQFLSSRQGESGLCMVKGEFGALAEKHPKRIRGAGDGARLLSSNDTDGYTFRGRFTSATQAFGVSSIVTQKAHSALRWLIERQGSRGDQVFVAWAIAGKPVPDPLSNSLDFFAVLDQVANASDPGDAGERFALQLRNAVAGYRAKLDPSDDVVIMGLDAATPGRLAITFYRELKGSEFLDRISAWHRRYAWPQQYSRKESFTGAPAPAEIGEAAYGQRMSPELRKATVERLMPCIVDGRPLPRDLVVSCLHRACNAAGFDKVEEWEKCLGITCALVRGSSKEDYRMSLEENRINRDYLYGRLLAIAENIEERALHVANESRDTHALKLMQRFANHPFSTWRTIELALTPYRSRLRANRPGLALSREKLLDDVKCLFRPDDFLDDSKLSAEFLLGYHCQRAALWAKADTSANQEKESE